MNEFDELKVYRDNKIDLDKILDNIKYEFEGYVPKKESIKFVEFRKLIRGETENKTPVVHYKVLDNIFTPSTSLDDIVMCHRGFAKTTIIEELYWHIACFNKIPNFGKTKLSLYVSDSIDNGVKTMRTSMDLTYENSDFLQSMLPKIITTDIEEKKGYYSTQKEISFINAKKEKSWLKMFGAQTGVRGTKIGDLRPEFGGLDDLIQKEEDALSEPTMRKIESTVYSDIEDAMHPTRRKIIWFGTPFNENDPLYKATESGAWRISVYPVCEKFPCKREEFRGSWEDRFTYDATVKTYLKRKKVGAEDMFYREMMLRVASMEERLIKDSDLVWFKRDDVLKKRSAYNFYITTDFATSERKKADNSVILVWAITSNIDMLLVDGTIGRRLMDRNIDDLFRFAQMYKPISVGIEVTGQQGGFTSWIRREMLLRNIVFNLASSKNNDGDGIRPVKNKFQRLLTMQPKFAQKKIWLPEELRNEELVVELLNELKRATRKGLKGKDDVIDAVTMLEEMDVIAPMYSPKTSDGSGKILDLYGEEIDTNNPLIL